MTNLSLKDLKLDEVLDEMRAASGKRAAELLGEGRGQARRALGGHDDGALLMTLTVGVVLGALVGAIVALLTTPASGSETRRKIVDLRARRRAGREHAETGWDVAPTTGNGHPAAPVYSDLGR